MSTEPAPRTALAYRALQHANFRLFIGGYAVSLIGTWIQSIAVSWLLFRLTGSGFYLGLAQFCSTMPVLLLGPVGGLAADHFPRHRIVLLTQSMLLLQATALAYLTLSGRVAVPQVLGLGLLLGCVNAFDIPARQSLMILLTSREDLLGAISLNSIAFNAARTVGPSLGGLLVAAVGEGMCFAMNAVSFLAVLASLFALRIPPVEPNTATDGRSLRDGLRYAWKNRVVRNALLVCGVMTLTNAAPLVLGPVIAETVFSKGATGLGVLMASFGSGATIGVLRLASRTHSGGMQRVVGTGALLYGLALLGYAAAPTYWLACAAAFCAGFSFFRQNAANNTLIQTAIHENFRGRVMSLYTMMAVGVLPFGSLATGWAVERMGPRAVLALAGIIAAGAGAMFLRYTRSMESNACTAS